MSTRIAPPTLQPTRQEKASGFLSATLLILGLLTLFMLVTWLSQQRSDSPTVTRLRLPSKNEQAAGSTGTAETFRMLEDQRTENQPLVTEQAVEQLQTVSTLATTELAALERSGGPKGIGVGDKDDNGREKGPGGKGGPVVPNWQRWQIRYSAADVQEYATVLDAFGVELGVMGGGVETIDYAYKLAQARPLVRSGKPEAEKRLRFTFASGELKEADRTLAAKAGLSIDGRVVCQFFPDAVKQQLEFLEREALGSRTLASVRHTVFGIRKAGRGLEFFVERVEPARPAGGLAPL